MGFEERMLSMNGQPLTACGIAILQVNLGYSCNMACKHCHVEARPDRSQTMSREIVDVVLDVIERNINTLDITGGAPELNPHFRYLVEEARNIGSHVMVRTNLTIFFEEGMEDLPEFYADNSVEVIASLPYYTETDVDRVRGRGTFEKCISALQRLNDIGYGNACENRKLNLVYNPAGAFLSPPQEALRHDYKKELERRYGISFDELYTFSNMPIGRFRDHLIRMNNLEKYTEKLVCAFNPETIPGLMCRRLVSVGPDGALYDCDFNQMLGLTVQGNCPQNVREFDYSRLAGRTITVGDHCYACTAGQGST
ncbi:MAG: arsenosugar biosynthesis radical SAM protein ArsS [Candidatus Sulfobium sp.]|jgi:radical SAM/Cys-rich protein